MALDSRHSTGDGPPKTALPAMVEEALRHAPEAKAIEFDGRWYHWKEIAQLAQAVRQSVRIAGGGVDAPVALVARNHPAVISALLGLLAEGRSVQMIYAFQSSAALARDIERLEPCIVIAMAQDIGAEVRDVLASHDIAAIALEEMSAAVLPDSEQTARVVQGPDHPSVEILTSGTTGPPKRFPISFDMISRHMMGNVGMAGAARKGEQNPVPFLLFFPIGNISGIYSTIPTLLRGQPAVLLERFSLQAWREFILRYRPTASGLPPTAFQMLLDADIPREDLASIKVMATGAAPLDPGVQRAFEEKYGIPVLLSYGATEFGGPVATMNLELLQRYGISKLGSVGQAMPGAKLRVVDPASGAQLPAGAEGLLEVVSPRIGADWIRTSDIAVIDADGFLFIRGRSDGAILRGGFKLVPDVIERALMQHPAIGASAVVGVDDRRLGQVPGAAIQCAAGATLTALEAEVHLRALLPATHIPVHWCFVEELPKNPSMKIDRPAVAGLFIEAGAVI